MRDRKVDQLGTSWFAWRLQPWLLLADARDLQVARAWGLIPNRSANPLTRRPSRHWSQSDEDGILREILARTGPTTRGVFLELGVGDGSENNTLALLARGWSGGWVGGEKLAFSPVSGGRLAFVRDWIDRDNVVNLARTVLRGNAWNACDVVSVDLDGNDFHVAGQLLASGLKPRVWVMEYNGRFPVGTRWVMAYDCKHKWRRDDYFGASISSLVELFESHGYFPVACSAQGANVFFVRDDFRTHFSDIPTDLDEIFQPPIHYSIPRWGHRPSRRTLQDLTRPNED